MDLFDEIWQASSVSKQKAMDDLIKQAVEKNPQANDNTIHRAVTILSGTIPNEP